MGPEAMKLHERFERMKADGLLDMQITMGDCSGLTLEQACADVNAVLDVIERGEYTELEPLGDSVRQRPKP